MQTHPSAPQRTLPWRVLLVLLLGLIGSLALTPVPPSTLSLGWDKLNHMLAFTCLALCATLGWCNPRTLRLALLAALLAFGGLIELLQRYGPHRTAEWGDLWADVIGVAVGVLVAKALVRLWGNTARPGR